MRYGTAFLFAFTMAFNNSAVSQPSTAVSDPEIDFLNTPESIKNEWGIRETENVHRMNLDLNGDGAEAVFLVFDRSGGKFGPSWTVYVPDKKGGYIRYDGVEFRPDTFRAGKVEGFAPQGGLLAYYPGKGGGDLVRFQFSGGKSEFENLRSLDTAVAEDGRLFETIFGRNWSEPLPAEYFEHPPYQVVAVRDIRARMPQSAEVINTDPKVQKPFPAPAAAEQKTTSANVLPRTVPSDEHGSRSSTFWIICLIAIAVALGSLWYIVARRS